MPSKPGAFRGFSACRARSTSEREIVKDTSSWLSSVIGAASIGGGSPSSADWEACLTKNALRISALSTSFSRDRHNVALFHAIEKCYFMRFVL